MTTAHARSRSSSGRSVTSRRVSASTPTSRPHEVVRRCRQHAFGRVGLHDVAGVHRRRCGRRAAALRRRRGSRTRSSFRVRGGCARISFCSEARTIASTAPNGSSINSTRGSRRERARDADALRLAAGELARIAIAVAAGVESDQRQQLVDARGDRARASQPSSAGTTAMFSATVRCGKSPTAWIT